MQNTMRITNYEMYQSKHILTTDEAAAFLGVKRQWIRQLCCDSNIPRHKHGRRNIFIFDELVEWLKGTQKRTNKDIEDKVTLLQLREKYLGKGA